MNYAWPCYSTEQLNYGQVYVHLIIHPGTSLTSVEALIHEHQQNNQGVTFPAGLWVFFPPEIWGSLRKFNPSVLLFRQKLCQRWERYFKLLYIQFDGPSGGILFEEQHLC